MFKIYFKIYWGFSYYQDTGQSGRILKTGINADIDEYLEPWFNLLLITELWTGLIGHLKGRWKVCTWQRKCVVLLTWTDYLKTSVDFVYSMTNNKWFTHTHTLTTQRLCLSLLLHCSSIILSSLPPSPSPSCCLSDCDIINGNAAVRAFALN